jgi:hypothetical protein
MLILVEKDSFKERRFTMSKDMRPGVERGHPEAQDNKSDDLLSSSERVILGLSAGGQTGPLPNTCPVCGQLNTDGALVCPHCQSLIAPDAMTMTHTFLTEEPIRSSAGQWPSGDVFLGAQRLVIFVNKGQEIVLPLKRDIVIGRLSKAPGTETADVDLTAFGGVAQGVSRLHAKLSVVDDMIYVTDLGSSNGTTLNGRRLAPHVQRLLRSGDELRLGQLHLKVMFTRS